MSAAARIVPGMDVLLIPGLWLDASSWDDVSPALSRAGHTVHALTMPGLGAPAAESADVGLADWVDEVVRVIDEAAGPVALVGHSGGGNVAWAAAAARPDRVARVIFVDTVPPPEGADISEFDAVDGVVPFPGWDFFDAEDVADLDADTRARTAPLTRSVPVRVPSDPVHLADEARYGIPVTILSGGMDEAALRGVLSRWGAFAAEFDAIADTEVVRLGTGHWPQFSDPERLSAALVAALR